jgi:hypothetical protein
MQPKRWEKVYPNQIVRPYAKVNRDEIATLHGFFGQYRMTRPGMRGQMLPNARYVFVTEIDGAIRMHPTFRHQVLASGQPVAYAGEAQFLHGRLEWWSNASGHYRPDADHASQAGLPMETFFTHEQVRSGIHAQKALRAVAKQQRH